MTCFKADLCNSHSETVPCISGEGFCYQYSMRTKDCSSKDIFGTSGTIVEAEET